MVLEVVVVAAATEVGTGRSDGEFEAIVGAAELAAFDWNIEDCIPVNADDEVPSMPEMEDTGITGDDRKQHADKLTLFPSSQISTHA